MMQRQMLFREAGLGQSQYVINSFLGSPAGQNYIIKHDCIACFALLMSFLRTFKEEDCQMWNCFMFVAGKNYVSQE